MKAHGAAFRIDPVTGNRRDLTSSCAAGCAPGQPFLTGTGFVASQGTPVWQRPQGEAFNP
jgi:hypothetical protein